MGPERYPVLRGDRAMADARDAVLAHHQIAVEERIQYAVIDLAVAFEFAQPRSHNTALGRVWQPATRN